MTGAEPDFARLRAPGEEAARRRAWTVAQAALAERAVGAGAAPRRSKVGLATLAAALAAVMAALALTAPGRAAAEWVREQLSEAAGHDTRPARPSTVPAPYGHLPGGGRLLATTDEGLVAFGLGDAPRKLLGHVDAAAWSPRGRFAVAVRGIELIAVDLRGDRRWSLAAEQPVRWPAWSPSGYRVAYVTGDHGHGGRAIHVVAGDGTGDRVVAASGPAPPAWQPGVAPAERLATVDAAGRVALRDADRGHVLWRARLATAPRRLAWTSDGRRLLALQRHGVVVLDGATGARVGATRIRAGLTAFALAARPGRRHGYALVRQAAASAQVVVVSTDATYRRTEGTRAVLLSPGPIRAIAWSPKGDWLAVDRAGVDGWDLVHVGRRGADRTRALAAGRGARLAGWCCG